MSTRDMGSIMTSCERECMIVAVDKAASEYQREINFFRSAAQRKVLVLNSPALCTLAARRPDSCSSICSAGTAPLMGLMMYRRTACCYEGNQMLLRFTEIRGERRREEERIGTSAGRQWIKNVNFAKSIVCASTRNARLPGSAVLLLAEMRKPKKAEKKSYKSSEPSQVGQLAKRA